MSDTTNTTTFDPFHDLVVAVAVAPSTPSAAKLQRNPRRRRGLTRPDKPTPNDVAPCSECGKKFSSRKALFGHMRCHPERNWRGINPPPPPPRSRPLSPVTDEHEMATCLLLLANGSIVNNGNACAFECSSCKKVFRSHQALGGHRASHKNVEGCFAMASATSSDPTATDWACSGPNYSAHGLGFDLNQPVVVEDGGSDDLWCYSSSTSTCPYLDLRLSL